MKKSAFLFLYIAFLILLSAGSVFLILYFYDCSAFFRSLFEGGQGAVIGPVSSGGGFAAQTKFVGRISLYIFMGIIVIQFVAFFLAMTILRLVKKSTEHIDLKLQKLENADIFLDLPLYVGLFGTVASFIVMTFNPQVSRLIAYSSTLIGIIFSVSLRTIVLFPTRQYLLVEKSEHLAGE
ncbi:MAG: hypothetical protein GY750_01340 [Lentisphaerae bacterium]|nr:hypothetical protein [Lentisphaerota bacterium]MCP4100063.1 hypothetical protein [Lentisphaerota bacterium]